MRWSRESILRRQIVETHRKLYAMGFSVANDGNTSVRLDDHRVLITPTGVNKAQLKQEQIVMIDREGNLLDGVYAPSSETLLHVTVYNKRPDVRAIIHAHPPCSVALSLAGISLSDCALPELLLSLGLIPTTPYMTPTTQEAASTAANLLVNHDALIMNHHGTITVGSCLETALTKVERIEHAAKIIAIGRSLGPIVPIPQHQVEQLLQIKP